MSQKKSPSLLWVVAVVTLIGMLGVTGVCEPQQSARPQESADQPIGEVNRIQGSVSLRNVQDNETRPANEKDPVFAGDAATTGEQSKVWIQIHPMPGERPESAGHASLGERSTVEFMRSDQEGDAGLFTAEAAEGLIRFIKLLRKPAPPNAFTVTTPTALVDVIPTDRSADFVVEVLNGNRTIVYVIWGAVKVRHISDQFRQERIVRSCQKMEVDIDKEPSPVMGVSPATLRDLIRRTTIPRTLPEDVPDCSERGPIVEEYVESVPVGPPRVRCPCPPNQELIAGVCRHCPSWKHYNRHLCACGRRCRDNHHCGRCEHCVDGQCRPKECPPGEWLDHRTCRCTHECHKACPPGTRLNKRTCRCEATLPEDCRKKCPPGTTLNLRTCRCEDQDQQCHKKCPPGQILTKDCRCVSKCDKKCGPHEWLDPALCRCEPRCRKTCGAGERLNVALCKCEKDTDRAIPECKRQCPKGYRLESSTCRCVVVREREDVPREPRPRPTEPPRVKEPPRTTEPPRVKEPPRTTEPPRVKEPPRTTEPPRVKEPPRTTEPPRVKDKERVPREEQRVPREQPTKPKEPQTQLVPGSRQT